ncbi:LysR family transcriptional regulator [Breoghania sp.]|uniref:LysR family transcriptional regulator n=1 Tax=Breoghania sp. TaxID=2065378 RepID=UPI002AAB34E4|nr:LysR family transcriptional regulator [Breoghania sp.]
MKPRRDEAFSLGDRSSGVCSGEDVLDRTRYLYGPTMRYFEAVARAGSVRGAARELNVASSAVNRQILSLEDALGVSLFERVGRGLRLSHAGEIMLAHVRRTLGDYAATFSELDALKGLRRGIVRIASVESFSEVILPQLVRSFRNDFKGISVEVIVSGSDEVSSIVSQGSVDIGFTYEPPEMDRLQISFRRDMPIGCIMHPDHQLSKRESLTLGDCLAYPVALPRSGLSLRARLDATMRGCDYPQGSHVESNSLSFMKALARSGEYVAFQTRLGVEQELAEGTLVFRDLTDEPLKRDRFAVVTSNHRGLALAPAMFFDHAVEMLKKQIRDE